jgi:imidazolonepropionase-like amidohydrolase
MNDHMSRQAAIVLMGAISVLGLRIPASAQRQTPAPLVVRCGTLIHPHSHQVQKNVAIQTVNGKIIRVAPVSEVTPPEGAQVLDFSGKFVMPGLVDLHAHTYTRVSGDWTTSNEAVPAFLLAAGVTTARAPGSMNPGADLAMRNRINAQLMTGPRYYFAGEYLDLAPPLFNWFNAGTGADDFRMKIDYWSAQGATAVKLYTRMSGDALRAVIAHAHNHGLKVIAHLGATGWKDAMEAGVDELCHGLGAFPEAGLKEKFEGLDQLDLKEPRYAAILRLAASLKVVLVPTAMNLLNITPDRSPENRRYYTEAAWKALEFMESEKAWGIPEKYALAEKEFIRMAHAAGCLLGTGTDLVLPWMPPGISLWREAEIFAEAGLPPMDVLDAATWNGIYSIGATDQLGTIEPGKLADFVVLDANPLDDIRNLRRVHRVVKSGTVYDPRQILSRLRGRLN